MFLWWGLMVVAAVSSMELDCQDRLDVIDKSIWPGLPSTYRGRDLLDEAILAAVGFVDNSRSIHSVIHTEDKKTFIRGNLSLFHLYGNDMTRELIEIRGKRVKDIQFGWQFIAILTEDGVLWTAGSGSYGELGHHYDQNRPIFSPVQDIPAVSQVAIGRHHSVVLTREGDLMSWGWNDRQQLGRTTNSDTNPIPQNVTIGQGMSPIKHVCCGWAQCTLLTENLEVFTWGHYQRIGRPSGNGIHGVVQGIPRNQTIRKVACGVFHTLVLTESGGLYGWGHNGYGELLGAPNDAAFASKLDLGERIVLDVVAGLYITAIRTYSSVGEYFGSYDGNDSQTPQLATNGVYTRDVMARSFYGQYTWGAVHVGCPTNGDGER